MIKKTAILMLALILFFSGVQREKTERLKTF
jgi:hypothetical protein